MVAIRICDKKLHSDASFTSNGGMVQVVVHMEKPEKECQSCKSQMYADILLSYKNLPVKPAS